MKILITGAKGQLGYHLQKVLDSHELFLGDTDNYDITKPEIVMAQTARFQPEVIIHAAAYTNVDGAETQKELCRAINVDGSRNVAEAAKSVNAKIVAISTDYVFAGDKDSPYLESDPPNPISYYGQTKLKGEEAVRSTTNQYYICRTAWLYGGPKPIRQNRLEGEDRPRDLDYFNIDADNPPFKNFVYTMLKIGRGKDRIRVVQDQIGSPTYAADLAETISQLIKTNNFGTYHITNGGHTNWADFAREIFRLAKYSTTVSDLTSEQWAKKNRESTKRPAYSVLANKKIREIGLPPLRDWHGAIGDFLSEVNKHE